MQHYMNMNSNMQQQQLNLTLYPTPFYYENGSQFNDLESYDGAVEGADNYTFPECPSISSYTNNTYLNVSCDTPLSFSVPLYGEGSRRWLLAPDVRLIDLIISRHHRTILHTHHTHRQLSNRYCAVEEEHADAHQRSIIRSVVAQQTVGHTNSS